MGSCFSSASAEVVTASREAASIEATKSTASPSPGNSSKETKSPPVRVHWPTDADHVAIAGTKRNSIRGIQKGYSSGASSISDEELETERKGHTRDTSDILRLESLKNSLLQDGTLSTNVVRMETPFGKAIESVYDGVHDGEILGSGISGVVRLVTHRDTGIKFAVKILDLGLIKSEAILEQLRDEIYIMMQLDHPHIVRLEEVYESTNEIYIVQELCLGGDLFDRLDMQSDYHYTEVQCAHLVKQMLSAIRYLHSKNIVHRDLKLENFLFSSTDAQSALKMIDFGLSKHFQFGEVLHDAVGTPYAVAPEVVRGSYNEKSDMWSTGVLTYLLLSGESPFGGCDGEPLIEVRNRILCGTLRFEPPETWALVSDLGMDFVRMLLNPDPSKRPSAKMAQRHPWIHQFGSMTSSKEGNVLNPNVIKSLVAFKELSDMRKLLSEVLSFTLLPEQIKDLSGEFEKIDEDGSGEISLSDLRTVLMKSAEAGTLGALTEQEIGDIFDSLRVSKSDPKIRWHEFIAAGLSQCNVDERNIKLAFERIDVDGKGFIILDDLRAMLGSDGFDANESLSNVWSEGLSQCANGNENQHICYEDFRSIMKGQAPEKPGIPRPSPGLGPRRISSRKRSGQGVTPGGSVPELPPVDESTKLDDESYYKTPDHVYVRQRSHSMKEKRAARWVNYDDEDNSQSSLVLAGRDSPDVVEVISDDSRTPIEVNRAVYRAHREMRMAVLEASKRFEEERARREHARKVALGLKNGSTLHRRASLVMKRGSVADLSMSREDKEQEEIINNASERGGRPARSKRKKTVSDMTGMLAQTPVSGSASSELPK
jgi:calcium-dependent protein kinase